MKLTALCAVACVTACAVDDSESSLDGDLIEAAVPIPGCASVTTVLLYSENTYELTLPDAFSDAQDRCTHYYVDLPHLPDKTMPRPDAAKVHQRGPNFHAMAEFSWSGWAQWIAASPGTRDWAAAGALFRQRMIAAGYDVAAGDTWVINEFPSTVRSGEGDARLHARQVVKALYGADGVPGTVFIAAVGQDLQNFAVYRPNVASWLTDAPYWSDMARYVRWFAYEVYADPHFDCVPGGNVTADAAHLDDYLEHVPRLAAAGGSATATAAAYLEKAFVPLLNAAWNSDKGFGDNRIDLAAFEKFSRLQVYATHVWAANHAYPGRRIGFAWSPTDSTRDQDVALSSVIARSVGRSYPAGKFYDLGRYACTISGSLDGCGCQVAGGYNAGWQTFARW